MHFSKSGWNWPSGSREKRFLIFAMYFRYLNYLPLGKGLALHLNKLIFHSPKDALCNLNSSMYFCYFVIISLWKRGGTLHLNIFESHIPNDAVCQVWLKLPQRFWKRIFLNFVNVLLLFCNFLPLKKAGSFIFVPSFVETGLLIQKKKIFKISQFRKTPNPGKGWGPSFEQTWIPYTQEYFVPSLVEIGPVVLEKKMKM